MAFCSYCGNQLTPGARFCASCGSPVENIVSEAVVPAPAVSVPAEPIPVVNGGDMDYGVVLYSIGTCAKSYADDVLEDILGYTDSEAKKLIKTVPVEIAQLLTMQQAQYIAQALTEYGMQVAVYKGQSPVDLSGYATQSVFNADGSLIAAALAALTSITVSNRIRNIRRWSRPSLLERLFAPKYKVVPPRHMRRVALLREPEPAPAPTPRRAAIPQRPVQRRMVSNPAPRRNAPGGPNGGRGGRSGGPGGPGGPGRGR